MSNYERDGRQRRHDPPWSPARGRGGSPVTVTLWGSPCNMAPACEGPALVGIEYLGDTGTCPVKFDSACDAINTTQAYGPNVRLGAGAGSGGCFNELDPE